MEIKPDVKALGDKANRKKTSVCGLTVGVFNVCGRWQVGLVPLHLALETQVFPEQAWPVFCGWLGFPWPRNKYRAAAVNVTK